jgi:hypothetical protein
MKRSILSYHLRPVQIGRFPYSVAGALAFLYLSSCPVKYTVANPRKRRRTQCCLFPWPPEIRHRVGNSMHHTLSFSDDTYTRRVHIQKDSLAVLTLAFLDPRPHPSQLLRFDWLAEPTRVVVWELLVRSG